MIPAQAAHRGLSFMDIINPSVSIICALKSPGAGMDWALWWWE